MKIYQTKNNTSSNDYRLGSHPNDNTLLFEAPDRLFINGMGHDKDTLAPIFGSTFQTFANEGEWFKLTNSVSFCQDSKSNTNSLAASEQTHMKPSADYLLSNNRQSIMAGVSISSIWRSTSDTNYIYFTGADPDGDKLWVGRYNISNAALDGFVGSTTSTADGNAAFFHEDDNYLYGVSHRHSGDTPAAAFIRVNKGNLTFSEGGFQPNFDGGIVILHVTDDYFVFFGQNSTLIRYFVTESGGVYNGTSYNAMAAGIGLVRFTDSFTGEKVSHLASKSDDTYDTPDWRSPFLAILDENGNIRYAGKNTTYDHGGGTINMTFFPTEVRNDPSLATYAPAQGEEVGMYPDSGGDYYSATDDDHHLVNPAIVSNSTLINTHKIIRTYSLLRTIDGEYVIIRNNVPLPENTNAFQAAASHPGSSAYGSSAVPVMDQRKCTITSNNSSLPSSFTDSSISGSSGFFSKVSGTYVCDRIQNMSYFEDNGNAYLMIDFAHPNTSVDSTNSAYHSVWVFKITNHTASLTNDPSEADSLALEIIQDVEIDDSCYALYRPTDDPKTFIAMSISTSNHRVYNWNTSTEQFTTSYSLNGNICTIGNDSNGNIYSAHKGPYGRFEIHAESVVLPNEITVVPAQTRYEYTGTTISSTVSVDAYNYLGNRIAATINLQILGSGVEFTDASATNNGKTISVTTSTSASTAVDIGITSSSFVRITASMSV